MYKYFEYALNATTPKLNMSIFILPLPVRYGSLILFLPSHGWHQRSLFSLLLPLLSPGRAVPAHSTDIPAVQLPDFRSRKLCDLNRKDSIRIRHTISFFWHQMNIHFLSHFHLPLPHQIQESSDRLTDKFQWFATVIRRVELCSIAKSSSVMSTTGFSHIAPCQFWKNPHRRHNFPQE